MPSLFSTRKFLNLFTDPEPPATDVALVLPPILVEPPAGLEKVVPAYLSARRKELVELTDLLAASDFPKLATLGHNLKGNGASFGFPEITRFGLALMQSAATQDSTAVGAELTRYKDYLGRVELVTKR